MSVTVELDEKTLLKAECNANIHDPVLLLKNLVQRESERDNSHTSTAEKRAAEAAKRLADLGGSMKSLEIPRRRRSEDYIP